MYDIHEIEAQDKKIIDALIEKHAMNVELFDLRGISGFADAFIIATARSEINSRSLREAVEDALEADGIEYKVEGAESSKWCLIDAGDTVVSIMSKEGREFYKIERLWGDAPMRAYGDETE